MLITRARLLRSYMHYRIALRALSQRRHSFSLDSYTRTQQRRVTPLPARPSTLSLVCDAPLSRGYHVSLSLGARHGCAQAPSTIMALLPPFRERASSSLSPPSRTRRVPTMLSPDMARWACREKRDARRHLRAAILAARACLHARSRANLLRAFAGSENFPKHSLNFLETFSRVTHRPTRALIRPYNTRDFPLTQFFDFTYLCLCFYLSWCRLVQTPRKLVTSPS